MSRDIRIFPDAQALSEAAAAEIVAAAKAAIGARGRFTLALAGGSTPRRTYELLARRHREHIDWARTVIIFGDERFVPANDARSNYKMAREALIDRVPIPAAHVLGVPTDAGSPREAADLYENTLRTALNSPGDTQPGVDLALLGVGPDGHTASLFPDRPEVNERERWVVAVEAPTHGVQPVVPRVSATLRFLDAAGTVLFLVAGADKRVVIGQILSDAPAARRYPASMVAPQGRAIWMLDRSVSPDDRPNA